MELFPLYRVLLTLGFMIPAAIIDVRTQRIPNFITFPMILIGLLINIILTPYRLIPTVAMLVFCLLLAKLPGVGMGDVKLLMGMSTLLVEVHILYILAIASVGVLLIEFIKHPKGTIIMVMTRQLRPITPEEAKLKNTSNAIPFAPYLLAATILVEGGQFLVSYLS